MNKISHNLCNRQLLTRSFSVAATVVFAALMVLSIVPTGSGMQTQAISAVADTIAPTVISTVPVNAAISVAVNAAMTATFSEAMAPLTISKTTFTLKQGVASITGTVTYSGVTATFKPNVNLAYNTAYTAMITTGVKDLAGNALVSNYTWTFTTVRSTWSPHSVMTL